GGLPHVFVDATSPKYDGPAADAWVGRLEETLAAGTPIVTCNKAPLAIAWTRITKAARSGGTTISCSATVGAGTPVLLILRRLEQAHGIRRIDATLNATLGYVLDRVGRGASLKAAVRGAQRAGWAEPDPTLDLDGTDAHAKSVIVHNHVFPSRRALRLGPSRPRLRIDEAGVRRLRRSGRTPRAIATITPASLRVSISGQRAGPFALDGVGRVTVRAELRGGSEAFLSGQGAGPAFTAGGVLGDLLALRPDQVGVRP
ncbi:MAG TPA: hypothetical protein VGR51_06745, partial [Thermoplasmata archaeon]|nr:hypothetical protein [Thermoplasmata archaeon]